MGVPKLWEILSKAGESRALAQLAVVEGFDKNEHGTRSFRLGIDAAIWLPHATASGGRKDEDRGAAAEVRTLFFRLCRLSRFPFSILFIFDGRCRPKEKRGSRMGKSGTHFLALPFQKLITMFGMDWREAKGEAEAELGRLNHLGHIDAVLTDDTDTFLFGARMLLRNVSTKLSGNIANPALDLNGEPSKEHAMVYTTEGFAYHPEIGLTRGGLVLVALLAGGDYDSGVFGAGIGVGRALGRLGYGDRLIHAYDTLNEDQFRAWLPGWRAEMTLEVQTNASGFMTNRHPSKSIPADFPNIETLACYVRPALSANGGGPPIDRVAIDVPALAGFCEQNFIEWGHRSKILYRFPNLVYPGVVFTVFRKAALIADKRETDRRIAAGALPGDALVRAGWQPSTEEAVGTPAALVNMCAAPLKAKKALPKDAQMRSIAGAFARRGTPEPELPAQVDEDEAQLLRQPRGPVREEHPLVVTIHSTRQHVSTDKLLEYRVEVCVKQLAVITDSGIKGKHKEPAAGASGSRGSGKSWRPNMNPGRRSKRYEDTESETEEPWPLPPPPQTDPEIDDPPQDDEPSAAPGATKKTKDPSENIRMWIPASIVRHVYPALVAEYEEKQAAKLVKKMPKKRATGAVGQPAPAASPPAGPSPAAVVQDAEHSPPLVRVRLMNSKGKAPARPTALEQEILRANPHASFAPPAEPVDIFAPSSMPFRNCGFVFSWPDTDDPDQLIVDTSERDDLPTQVDYYGVERKGGGARREQDEGTARGARREQDEGTTPAAKPRAQRAPSAAASSSSAVSVASAAAVGASVVGRLSSASRQERAAPKPLNIPRAAISASAGPSRGGGLLAQLDSWNLFGDYQAATGGTKRKARASVSSSPAKRSRINIDEALDALRDSSEEPDLPWQSSAPSARSSSPAHKLRSSPVPGPLPSSSPTPTQSSRSISAAPRRKAALDADIISIASDSDDEAIDDNRAHMW